MLGDKELQVLTAYLETGAHIAFNTLAPKEWFYLRVMERMASAFHRKHRARLFSRVHWIVSGGEEIFVYEHSHHSYRRIYFAPLAEKLKESSPQVISGEESVVTRIIGEGEALALRVNDWISLATR